MAVAARPMFCRPCLPTTASRHLNLPDRNASVESPTRGKSPCICYGKKPSFRSWKSARILAVRNHSTVIYSCDKVAESKNKGRVKQDLQAIKQIIYGVR